MQLEDPDDQHLVKCHKCEKLVEDILILTCEHNLCLKCSGENLKRESNKENYSFQAVVCDICGAVTILDPSAAEELLKEYNHFDENIYDNNEYYDKRKDLSPDANLVIPRLPITNHKITYEK